MTTRDDLLKTIQVEHDAWRALVAEVGEYRMEEPGPMGDWTFKDMVGHLHVWGARAIARIEAGPDENPPTAWPATLTEDDEINAWIHEQQRARPLRDVLADMDQWFDRLAALIETMPDDDLLTPGRFDFMGGRAVVDAQHFGHFHEEHEPDVRAWLQTRCESRSNGGHAL